MRRLLMISPHFPPDSSAATHRVRLLAPHLPKHGWQPIVLTLKPAAYEGRLEQNLMGPARRDVEIVRADAWPMSMTRRFGIGDLGLRAFAGLRKAAIDICRQGNVDAVFVTIYPTYPALLGPMLKKRFGLPFILDYQDPWVSSWGRDVGPAGVPDLKSRISRRIASTLEPRVLRAVDGVTAVSTGTYAEALARTGCKPKATAEIPIGWDSSDAALVATCHPSALIPAGDGLIHLAYVGTLLPKGVGVVRTLLGSLRLLDRRCPELARRLRFHSIGTSNQSSSADYAVLPHAREAGVADRVSEHPGRVDYLEALAVLRQSSAILLLGSTESHYTPSKVFPALLAARPILAVYHQASPVVPLLQRASPHSHVVTYLPHEVGGDSLIALVAGALVNVARLAGQSLPPDIDVLEPWSADALARRLARVCDEVTA